MKKFQLFVILILIIGLMTSCAGRVPTAKQARSASLSYFKKYGRKYNETPFGHKNISNVTINGVEEVSYKFALADTIITFVDGHAGRALVKLENKFPGGWKVISWELIGYR